MLGAVKTEKKNGSECFSFIDNELPIDVLTFWQWSSSCLLGNALRGQLAEFIVASAIGCLDSLRVEWDEYDLLTDRGLKIEIKSSSYLQSWEQQKLSKIVFGIQPTGISQTASKMKARKADVYIFCVLAHKDKNTVNPLKLDQWDFYILETRILNNTIPEQKTITLSSLLELEPLKVKYDCLAEEVKKLESNSDPKTELVKSI